LYADTEVSDLCLINYHFKQMPQAGRGLQPALQGFQTVMVAVFSGHGDLSSHPWSAGGSLRQVQGERGTNHY
jgi:hypothetical protein